MRHSEFMGLHVHRKMWAEIQMILHELVEPLLELGNLFRPVRAEPKALF